MSNSKRDSSLLPGCYRATIRETGWYKSEQGLAPEFVIIFTLDYFHRPGGLKVNCPNRKRALFLRVTDETVHHFIKSLKAIGYDGDNFDGLDPGSSTVFDFQGVRMEVQLKYDDEQREAWEIQTQPSGGDEQ